jgi:hypothetical protein
VGSALTRTAQSGLRRAAHEWLCRLKAASVLHLHQLVRFVDLLASRHTWAASATRCVLNRGRSLSHRPAGDRKRACRRTPCLRAARAGTVSPSPAFITALAEAGVDAMHHCRALGREGPPALRHEHGTVAMRAALRRLPIAGLVEASREAGIVTARDVPTLSAKSLPKY